MTPGTEIRKVVLIRPSALGDVCRTVPVLASLKRALPHAQIDWVVQDTFSAAIEAHPDLGRPILFPRSRLSGWWRNPDRFIDAAKWLNQLRAAKYDIALDLQGLSRSGIMTAATRARLRVGLRSAREFAWLGYNNRVNASVMHTVDQMLALVETLGITPVHDMRLYVPPRAAQWWKRAREELGVSESKPGSYIVIAPTSRWPSKNWPMERFAQILPPLLDRGFTHNVLIGSMGDMAKVRNIFADKAAERLRAAGFVVDLTGKTDIAQTMSVIAGAGLVIANDSAPLHMAVGFDRPIVGLFGPTDPAAVGPYQRDASVLRGYAAQPSQPINFKDSKLGDRLMRLISTTAVLQKVDQVLSGHEQANRDRVKAQAAARAAS